MATPNTQRRFNELELVKRRAANRTKQRFQRIADELAFREEERRLREEVQQRASSRTVARMDENTQPVQPVPESTHPLEQPEEPAKVETPKENKKGAK